MYVIIAYMETMTITAKQCTRCKIPKSSDDFYDRPKNKDGKDYWCKSCAHEYGKERYKRKIEDDPEWSTRRYKKYNGPDTKQKRSLERLRYVYGLSKKDIEFILELQGGKCPICNTSIFDGFRVVDHDHSTGKMRGIIHVQCNSGLGFFEDSVEKLRRAADYLADSEHRFDGTNIGALIVREKRKRAELKLNEFASTA
jgi:Recombination endonuclease VII